MNRPIFAFIALFMALFIIVVPCGAHERSDGRYFTIFDENANIVYVTGWGIRVGDQFLTAENRRYEIVAVDGDTARANYIGSVNMTQYTKPEFSSWYAVLQPSIAYAQEKAKVAVYHTHSDESYVPTDGKDSIYGNGGVYKVGDSFAEALKAKGLDVIHSDARHDPHDDMAYERSRRTAMDLIKQQPSAIFDVHRDSSPPEVYNTTINGQNVTKVQLVVGKYGPTGKQIEDYALQLKAESDKQHPGLIKGIFFAKGGDYNQDLMPRSMLLEVGAHTNDRASAERGIALFADAVPAVIGATSPAPQAQNGAAGVGTAATGPSGATKSIGWIVGVVVVGVIAFLVLSTGSFKEAGSKLKQFTSTEFANFFGSKKSKNKKRPDDDKEG